MTNLRTTRPVRVPLRNDHGDDCHDDEHHQGHRHRDPPPRTAHAPTPLRREEREMISQDGTPAHHHGSPVDAVLLDAYGTLVALDRPAERLRALLAAAGHPHPPGRVADALAAEIAHYRAHMHEGGDPAGLAALRVRCAGVLADALGGDAPPPPRLTPILLEALRFEALPDAPPALAALAGMGIPVAVVSNWDCGLPEVLHEAGLSGAIAAVCASAAVGAAKPDPAIFRRALAGLGVPAARAVHCGDHPDADCAGARAAGVRAVLLDRRGGSGDAPCPRVRDLGELVEWIKRCNTACRRPRI